MDALDPNRLVGEEARKAYASRLGSGFIEAYLSGSAILDIGYKGYRDDVVPIVANATGIELDYPGYDGVTLPFFDGSQDSVFASHCLEHIEDFQNSIQDWFRVLKIGGFLVIMVPHQFLYEKKIHLPSRYNADHKRFYTPASLMAEVEASLRPNTYRLRHLVDNDHGFDYAIPPNRHSGGCYEIELVIEKIRPPSWPLAEPSLHEDDREELSSPQPTIALRDSHIVLPSAGGNPSIRIVRTGGDPVAIYDFGTTLPDSPRILVLKLDHLGDFVIGLPSLRKLRDAFPTAYIRLVVGPWNEAAAVASKLADDVVTYSYFPQHAMGWDGKPFGGIEEFRAVTRGRYDIAIDLRVDDDTRELLTEVDAAMRCGIGARSRYGFLNVALPTEHAVRQASDAMGHAARLIQPDRFESRMPLKTAFYHETDFRPVQGHLVYGPHITLPLGRFRASFHLQMTGWKLGLQNTSVIVDVVRNGSDTAAVRRLRAAELRSLPAAGIELSFDNEDVLARHEFRVYIKGQPIRTGLRFNGVRLEHIEAAKSARYRRAELHIGEQLSLLVQLVADRTRRLYGTASPADPPPDPLIELANPPRTRQVVIAPFSNSDLRDWPFSHYVQLVRLLVERQACDVALVGSPQQAEPLDRLAREVGAGVRVRNLAGRISWSGMPDLLRQADLVISNNSGIAHLAAAAEVQTLAIYSGSHQPQEWGPRGRASHAMMAVVPCSPCGHDRLKDCPYEHRCMAGLAPETVFTEVCALLSHQRS